MSGNAPLDALYTDDGSGFGPLFRFLRESSSPAANDGLGGFQFLGRDSAGTLTTFGDILSEIIVATDGAERGQYRFRTTTNGSSASRLHVGQGLYHPSATGTDKGDNTINFGAVYDDSSLLTCMALQKEFLENREIDLSKWDALVPDQIVPEMREQVPVLVEADVTVPVDKRDKDGDLIRSMETRKEKVQAVELVPVYDEKGNGVDVVERPLFQEVVTPQKIIKRQHRTARIFKAMCDSGFDPRDPNQYFAKMRADEALPGMPTKADWVHNSI
jgi:hypothetical protein